MRFVYSTLALTFFVAGCSTCHDRRPLAEASTLPKPQCHRLPWPVDQYSLGALASLPVYDLSGNNVGHLEDVTIGASGCVISATVALSDGGARITVPFHRLKMSKKEDGSFQIRTDVLVKHDAAAKQQPAPDEAAKAAPAQQSSGKDAQ